MTTEQRLELLDQRLEKVEKGLKQMQGIAIAVLGGAAAAMAILVWAVW